MKIQIEVRNVEKAIRNIKHLFNESNKPMNNILLGAAQEIRKEAVRSIQQDPKTGIVYQKYNPTREHRASAPGESPATDTGNLVRNIKAKNSTKNEVIVQSNAPYSQDLELGSGKILPRPFLFPATEKSGKKIVMVLFNYIKNMIASVK